MESGGQEPDVTAEFGEGCVIGICLRAQHQVDNAVRLQRGQEFEAHQLAEPALEPISIHGSVLVLRHDESDPRMAKRGSKHPDVEVLGPDSPPLSNDGQYVATPREPERARITEAAFRRLRISWAV